MNNDKLLAVIEEILSNQKSEIELKKYYPIFEGVLSTLYSTQGENENYRCISANIISLAKEAKKQLDKSIKTKIIEATAASNVQKSTNCFIQLAAITGGVFSIVKAADLDGKLFSYAKECSDLMKRVGYLAETASLHSMELFSSLSEETNINAMQTDAQKTDNSVNELLTQLIANYNSENTLLNSKKDIDQIEVGSDELINELLVLIQARKEKTLTIQNLFGVIVQNSLHQYETSSDINLTCINIESKIQALCKELTFLSFESFTISEMVKNLPSTVERLKMTNYLISDELVDLSYQCVSLAASSVSLSFLALKSVQNVEPYYTATNNAVNKVDQASKTFYEALIQNSDDSIKPEVKNLKEAIVDAHSFEDNAYKSQLEIKDELKN